MEESKQLSVKENIEIVGKSLIEHQSSGREYKKSVELTKSEISGMDTKIELMIQDTPKSFFPQITELFSDLRGEITHQKNMNEYLQKQITELKKERSVISQHIVASNTSVSILQEKVGTPSKF